MEETFGIYLANNSYNKHLFGSVHNYDAPLRKRAPLPTDADLHAQHWSTLIVGVFFGSPTDIWTLGS